MKLLYAALITLGLYGAETTVTGPVVDLAGVTWTGTITLTPVAVTCSGGVLGPSHPTIKVSAGVLTQALCPGTYSVRYQSNTASWTRTWTVPASGPVTVKAIETGGTTGPIPGVVGTPSADGTWALQSVSGVLSWVAAPSGSGTSCGLTATDTWAAIEAGTSTCGDITAGMTWAQIEAQ